MSTNKQAIAARNRRIKEKQKLISYLEQISATPIGSPLAQLKRLYCMVWAEVCANVQPDALPNMEFMSRAEQNRLKKNRNSRCQGKRNRKFIARLAKIVESSYSQAA